MQLLYCNYREKFKKTKTQLSPEIQVQLHFQNIIENITYVNLLFINDLACRGLCKDHVTFDVQSKISSHKEVSNPALGHHRGVGKL